MTDPAPRLYPRCEFIWHDGQSFQSCPLRVRHAGYHARDDGTVPTRAELDAIEAGR